MSCLSASRKAAAAFLMLAGWFTHATAQSSSEPAVKAGFVYNFAKFTEWPAGVLGGTQISLCLIGGDPLGAVQTLLDGKPLQGRSVVVRHNVRAEEARGCGIVFITDVDERRQSDALRALRGLPVLTIGDGDGFVDAGGMIGLVTADDRIQFEVNLDPSQRAGLKINSQLLKLARAVKGRTPP
jgi:hypothetical protein